MAKLCLNVCELARLAIPTRATAALIALLIVVSSRWCRRVTPERGSRDKSRAGKMYSSTAGR